MSKLFTISIFFFQFVFLSNTTSLASGNHPEAGSCPKEEPYYAICTHSLHSLEGWFGNQCHADKQSAQHDAEAHAKLHHQGNMRWTGINQLR